ncbi:hypothetical protein EMPS_04154 [Entomortierella parvispora]|uniref:Protein kinase domain-containing protein n=1 Tax=Entomortierella parvispora TaxID=205924 RepID=A0A9P3LV94_9FUNG|nr:hypothetical protein EMPS_04154 [Entomortierella parvispora]
MADRTAPVVLLNDKEKHWLDGAIKDKLLRLIDFNDIHHLEWSVASGGFGVIHSGRWRGMRVAVKVLYNPADFIQEVGIHKLVQDSENIVKFYGITRMKQSGDYGMVLQFAGKGSLRDYLSRHFNSLDWVHKMRLARDVAAGISFIHEDNICHHDLHSRNVLIDQSGRALITDFGLSRYVNKANSNNGVRGVVPYISPERLKNSPFDHSSDVYSLGVIMWELSSGSPPFDQDGENFLLPFQIMRGRREEIMPGTPVEYSDLYQQCWDGEPLKRPSLANILKTLDSMLTGFNEDRVEELGRVHVSTPGNLQATRSMPTRTHTILVEPEEPLGKSAPISGLPGHPSGRLATGSASQVVTNVGRLNPRHPVSRQHNFSTVMNPLDGNALGDQINNLKITEDKPSDYLTPGPVTPTNTPLWLRSGRRQDGPGYGGCAGLPPSPKPTVVRVHQSDVQLEEMRGATGPVCRGVPVAQPPAHQFQHHQHPNQQQRTPYPVQQEVSPVVTNSTKPKSDSITNSTKNNRGDWKPKNGKTNIRDFFTACRQGNLEAVHWHLMQGASVMEPYDSMSGRTPLHAAAMSDSFEVMKLLCESAGPSLNMNELDDSSQTPLHLLTQYGRDSYELLVYMLEKGADPNAQDSERRTPLMTTFILNDNAQMVETLLDYGADPNIRCQENNALAEAAIRVRFQCVKVLLETDLSMSEQSSLEHAMDVCYRVTETVNRNQVLSLLVRWRHAEGIQKRQTLARMILNGSLQLGERRIDQRRIARQVLTNAGNSH